jgi:hypothetical protein
MLPTQSATQRQHGGSRVIQRRGFARSAACVQCNVFGVRAGPEQVGRGEDFVAGLPLRGARSASHDDAADVVAQQQRPFARHGRARTDLGIHGVHRGGVHLDQHVGIAQ